MNKPLPPSKERGPQDQMYGTVSLFNLPMKSGKTLQFEADEFGNIAVWEWNVERNKWDKIWGRLIYVPPKKG